MADDAVAEQSPKPDGGLVETSVSTQHSGLGGLTWTATAASWILRDGDEKAMCTTSFVAYEVEVEDPVSRPVMFVFNGGPGSAAIWLHLGVFGPRRLDLGDGLRAPAPPYTLVDNPDSLLPVTDLVFIDPVGTGFSRPAEGVEAATFYGLAEDAEWVGRFISLWLSRRGRWASPKLVAGESYGTTRAAMLAEHLGDKHGIALAGVVLVSTVVSFSTLYPGGGNDLPYPLALPTLAATAHAHGRTAPDLGTELEQVVAAAEDFALGDYATALLREHLMDDGERKAVAERLSAFTGLPAEWLVRNRLRVDKKRFCKELLRDEGLVVGHFDGRITSKEADEGADATSDDQAFWTVRWPFSAAWQHYLRAELGVEGGERYEVIQAELGRDWKWGEAGNNQYADAAAGLRTAMLRNPRLRVFMANGYYDFATPFFAAEWSIEHLALPVEQRAAVTVRRYAAGHMMYTDATECAALARDVGSFITG